MMVTSTTVVISFTRSENHNKTAKHGDLSVSIYAVLFFLRHKGEPEGSPSSSINER